MPADNVEFSGDRRFRLFHWEGLCDGAPRRSIRLEHAPTSTTVLDLTDDACDVESWHFSDGGKLLHLKLSRTDRSIVGYPATIDLETGLYYHHPRPRDAHAPAGHASDLEIIARTGRPPEHAPGDPVRWPPRDKLDWSEIPGERVRNPDPPVPAAPAPEPAGPAAIDGLPYGLHTSSDGQWRFESARIVHTPSGRAVFDLGLTPWQCDAQFTPCCNQLLLTLRGDQPEPRLVVKIDLDCMLYWEMGGSNITSPGGVQAGTLSDLHRRLTRMPGAIAPPTDGMLMGAPTLLQQRWVTNPAAPQPRAVAPFPPEAAIGPVPDSATHPLPERLRPIVSPDGRYRVEFFEYAMRMSHTVRSACIRNTTTGAIILDFSQTLDDVQASFPGEPHVIHLTLRRYPGDRTERHVGMNLDTRTWWDLGPDGRRASRDFVYTGTLDEQAPRQAVRTPAGAPGTGTTDPQLPARVLTSDNGAWRIELFETGRTDVTARGETRPYYRAIFVRAADGVTIADCGKFGYDAWVMGQGDRLIQLSRGKHATTWIQVDLASSDFAYENLREPISESYPMGDLPTHLKSGAS